MNKFLSSIALFTVAVMTAAPVQAQKIHAGSASGSYTNDFCPQVQEALKAEYFDHQCATSQGSGDNVEKVLATPTDVGLGQFDVVAAAVDQNPGKLAVVNPGVGLECLYAVTTDPNVTNLSGLSARMPVALPPEKSGSTGTFQFLQSLDEGLAQLRNVTYYDSAKAAVDAVISNKAALAFFVQFANTKNEVFQAINDAKLTFVPVINRAILRREVAGQRVYQPQEVVVTPAGLLGRLTGKEPEKIVTTCMPVVLFTGDPSSMPEGTARQDQEDVLKQLAKVQPPSQGDWKDILNNTIAIGKNKLDELMQQF